MALAGKAGSVDYAPTTGGVAAVIGDLRQWSLNIDSDMFEISTFGSSGWKEFQPNLNGAQGSISGYWNVSGSTSMKNVQTHILSQAAVPAKMNLIVAGTNGYTGNCFITGLSPQAAVDGIVEFSADFTYTGAVAYSTAI